ncbi:Protein of unknown function [Gryllus bimaculatus]|nr:Protein of unknown function [Gryllus bimaculatus]
MAGACSESMPVSPTLTSETDIDWPSDDKTLSPSPSNSSMREDRWPHLVVSMPPRDKANKAVGEPRSELTPGEKKKVQRPRD